MTEHQIYKILLKNEEATNYDFDCPNLQRKTVNLVSKNLTNIIYESLKQKSSASSLKRKRLNILRFINTTCEVKEAHIGRSTDKCLELIQKSFKNTDEEELASFTSTCSDEIQSKIHFHISHELKEHYGLKNLKYLKKMKHLEFIKEEDQKSLDLKYNLHVRKNISYHNANDDVLRTFLADKSTDNNTSNVSHTIQHRKSLIKLAYATMNLKSMSRESEESSILEKVLHTLSDPHISFDEYEQNFLKYLWNTDNEIISRFMENFFFLLEQEIFRHSTAILTLTTDIDVCQYFVDLEDEPSIIKIRKICREHNIIYLKLKSFLYELYYLSYCNRNILKLCDLVI